MRQHALGYNHPVDARTIDKLKALNRQFYQTLGEQFSATRKRLQPGVQGLLPSILNSTNILDLGCGNGELARHLSLAGYQGQYTGLDLSQTLLNEAVEPPSPEESYRFLQADLTEPDWAQVVCEDQRSGFFDCILAFASLHHLPGKTVRVQVLHGTRRLISPQGRMIHSEWMFLNSSRMRSRIHRWERIGLQASQVDPGDHLLDWKAGGYGLRYVHQFTSPELEELAAQTGFRVQQSFLSDGDGNKLSLYQVWLPYR